MSQMNHYTEHLPLQGQCYCQAITYELTNEPISAHCCHCRNCQALTGSTFATILVIERRHMRLTSTKTQPITRIPPFAGSNSETSDVKPSSSASASTSSRNPAAAAAAAAAAATSDQKLEQQSTPNPQEQIPTRSPERKATYCPQCNTMLWSTAGHFGDGLLFVRAGTLVNNEVVVPEAHLYVRSKVPWVELPVGVNTFETLPARDGSTPSLWSEEAMKRVAEAS